jgi:FkbM family methyltransferase
MKQKGRVMCFNLAIGDKEGVTEMFLHEDHTPSSSLLATTKLAEQYYPFTKGQKRISVMRTTLDIALAEIRHELSSEILIKLDVQGYEDRVIAGGVGIFARASACVVEVSLDTLYEGQAGFRYLVTMLDDMGYRYHGNLDQTYGEDGHCIFLDAVFLKEAGKM